MTFSTKLSAAMNRILMLTGTMSSSVTFTTESKTVKLVSEHFEEPNMLLQPERFQLEYQPRPGDSLRVSWRTDRNSTHGVTIDLEPYSYTMLSTHPAEEDSYTVEREMPCEQGKTLEISITTSTAVKNRILGMSVDVGLSRSAAYVGGLA